MKQFFQKHNFSTAVKTALYDFHVQQKGKMVEFAGFNLPIAYSQGQLKEHLHCRSSSSLFDVSHMGQIRIYGKDREDFVKFITVADIDSLNFNQATLSLILNEKAGIIDDTIITKFEDNIHMVLNAGNKYIDIDHFNQLKEQYFQNKDLQIQTFFDELALISVQGPKTQEIIQKYCKNDLSKIPFMTSIETQLGEFNVSLNRCGYTGEDGFEISTDSNKIAKLCEMLLENDELQLAGLGARDSLRLEAGLCLHGNEMNENISPVQAQLMWTVSKNPEQKFHGYESLMKQKNEGVQKKRVGFLVEGNGIVRNGELFDGEGNIVGNVTSGIFGPSLGKGVGMAYVPKSYKLGNMLTAKVRNKDIQIKLKKMPFIPAQYYRI